MPTVQNSIDQCYSDSRTCQCLDAHIGTQAHRSAVEPFFIMPTISGQQGRVVRRAAGNGLLVVQANGSRCGEIVRRAPAFRRGQKDDPFLTTSATTVAPRFSASSRPRGCVDPGQRFEMPGPGSRGLHIRAWRLLYSQSARPSFFEAAREPWAPHSGAIATIWRTFVVRRNILNGPPFQGIVASPRRSAGRSCWRPAVCRFSERSHGYRVFVL